MINSFEYFNRTHLDFLCPRLICEESAEQILAVASLFPESPSGILCFECLLSESSRYADFGFILDPHKQSFEEASAALSPTRAAIGKKKHWNSFFNFFDQCGKRGWYKNSFEKLWLFFDLGRSVSQTTGSGVPDPTVYFSFLTKPHLELVEPFRENFTQEKMSKGMRENLDRCYEECKPLNLHVRCFALMCSRSLDLVRIYVGTNAMRSNLGRYLSAIGYSCDIEPVVMLLEKIDPYLGRIGVGLDVGESIHDRINIECFIPSCSESETKLRWNKIFSVLSSLNIISQEKKNILLNWIGGQKVSDGQSTLFFLRTINEIKFIIDKSGRIEAKVYLMAHKI